jgi:hypothetical protein
VTALSVQGCGCAARRGGVRIRPHRPCQASDGRGRGEVTAWWTSASKATDGDGENDALLGLRARGGASTDAVMGAARPVPHVVGNFWAGRRTPRQFLTGCVAEAAPAQRGGTYGVRCIWCPGRRRWIFEAAGYSQLL